MIRFWSEFKPWRSKSNRMLLPRAALLRGHHGLRARRMCCLTPNTRHDLVRHAYEKADDALLASPDLVASSSSKAQEALETDGGRRSSSSMPMCSVLTGCPWVAPRPLYVLAVACDRLGPDQAAMYLLQARMDKSDATTEMDRVLGQAAGKCQISELRDGVVAFDQAKDAELFAQHLTDTGSEAFVATFDSHELFRMMGEVHGVVIHLKMEEESLVPEPAQLARYVWGERN